jgi:hypothetical protein
MPLSRTDRAALIDRYASGPALFKATIAKVPKDAFQWRPAPGKWSAHEVIVHCADSETNAHARIRYLVAEERPPVIQGYDQARWAHVLDYHSLPWEPALATVEAVRANTTALLKRMTDEQWARVGSHTESGTYGALDWLTTYAEHLEIHARQLERNIAAWGNR